VSPLNGGRNWNLNLINSLLEVPSLVPDPKSSTPLVAIDDIPLAKKVALLFPPVIVIISLS